MVQHHILLVTFPAQGHINPALQFAKCLTRIGGRITFSTCVSAHRRMSKTSLPNNLSFATFSDGYDAGLKPGDDYQHYMTELSRRGSQALSDLIVGSANEGKPFTCLVYTILLPWAADVASVHSIPSALLWIQPAMVFDIYYYYFNGYGDMITNNCNDPSYVFQLPGLPPLSRRDLPSFMMPTNSYGFALPLFQEQLQKLNEETNPKILVNTFDALEPEALKAIEKFKLTAIGPLIPSAYLDGKDPSDTCFGGDIFQNSKDYLQWLNSKPKGSVVYVSFGSISVLSKRQKEEIAGGLLLSGLPFLWVVREETEEKKEDGGQLGCCKEELEKQGMMVAWCSQLEVLSHPAVGCFLTHCGWNSTMESLVSGVPVVAFPQWTDQGTNGKLVEDVWKTGVRVNVRNEEEGIVEREEIRRCLDLVMRGGERGEEMRRNAKKWKDLAKEAVKEGGSSDKNLKAFVNEVGHG